jgi:Fe-S oxidoreductase
MASYKAEFLSHYYEGRLRPRHAYAFGLIHRWAQLASRAPTLVNFLTHTPGLRSIAKALAGMAPQRSIPAFAPKTFKAWFAARSPRNFWGPPVVLFADTFNNHFHPEVARAAVEVLEHAGFRVTVPAPDMCCGRPLYDYGMLNRAKAWLEDILIKLDLFIKTGIPIVVLEPSCCAVFRDELLDLFPNNENAKRLSQQVCTLGEFLRHHASEYKPPQLGGKALMHGHCHQKAIMGIDCERQVLESMGLEVELPDSGCCGMAGSFGFEAGQTYDVSVKCGERALLPRVRQAREQDLIIADGFSCRTQIEQGTRRRALHLAQVLKLALLEEKQNPRDERPEAFFEHDRRTEFIAANTRLLAFAGGAALAVFVACTLFSRNARKENPRKSAHG